jgi:hypothetical protein
MSKNERPIIEIKRLYPVADCLGMTLTLDTKDGKIRGSHKRLIAAFDLGTEFDANVKVTSSFFDLTGEDVGVLLHIVGHMFLFAFHTESGGGQFTAHIVDGNKLPKEFLPSTNLFEREGVRSYNGAMKKLNQAVVASFTRQQKERAWGVLDKAA